MNIKRLCLSGVLVALALLVGCENLPTFVAPGASPTPGRACEFIKEAYYVSARAVLDAGSDGIRDANDHPLQGAALVVRLTDGTERRAMADAKGSATVILTVGTREDPDPRCRAMTPAVAEVAMEPPPGYELIRSDGTEFLFRKADR